MAERERALRAVNAGMVAFDLALGANERTFAIGIMLAASVSFIAPFEPSCILVYGPGKYKFRDFVKTGAPLTVILTVIVLLMLPVFWPLHSPAGAKANTTPVTSSTTNNLSPLSPAR